MSDKKTIGIGFIGAGGIARSQHLPRLREMDDAAVRVVCNRSEASSRQVAEEYDIPDIETDWQRLIERDDIDAVFIGTWPCTHKAMSIAALEAGKHVFCQSRMAMDLAEAKAMVQAAERHAGQVAMLCPPPHRMPWEPYVRQVIDRGELGELREVRLVSVSGANLGDLSWRERVELSGRQMLQVGIWAETLHAWVGEYASLHARLATPIATKRDAAGQTYDIQIPQSVLIHGRLTNGAAISEHHSGLSPHENMNFVSIYGSKGTLRVDAMKSIQFAPLGQPLAPVDVPAELQRPWRAERDFLDAVHATRQGESWQVSPDFHEGLRYMAKVEALHRSHDTDQAIAPTDLV
ncbi:Gfo/Idh/MocA family protein [Phycisphaerales bacterium AB-hyl4]|uniref:Gfo/Idh/MocA family protein n=1 Tax=Natronomicrosphaera hydrolytica TaxID=3242702 RepID=A0ABV4U0X4_9BACT